MQCVRPYALAKHSLGGIVVLLMGLQPNLLMAHEGEPDQPAGRTTRLLEMAEENKVSFGGGLTLVGQGMSGGTNDTALTYSADLAFTGHFRQGDTAFIYLNTAQGSGINTGAATSANADNESGTLSVDGQGFSDTRVAEAWYEFKLADMATLRVGKIDPTGIYDGNEIANDETTQFLAAAFVNNPAIAFPGYVAGLNIDLEFSDNLHVNLGTFESSADFAGALDSTFLIGEIATGYELAGRPGHLRLGAWADDAHDNQGIALNLEQNISDRITLFARYGNQDDKQDFDHAYSMGGQLSMGRDRLGIGYSLLTSTGRLGPDDESQLELYYSPLIHENLQVTLDLQAVKNPGFNSDNADVLIYGVRTQINF